MSRRTRPPGLDANDAIPASSSTPEIDRETARNSVAQIIINWAVFLILFFGSGTIAVALYLEKTEQPETALDVAQGILHSILPIISAWVGAVLAYYFVNKAAEEANRNTREALRRRSFHDTVSSVPITAAMRTMPDLAFVVLESASDGSVANPLAQILEIYDKHGKARAPLFEWDERRKCFILRYILHQSTVYEYLWRHRTESVDATSIQALLDDPITRIRWDMTVAHLPQRAALADAKAIMDGNSRIQDVIVTLNGRKDEAFIGWLTNVDILRRCVAGATSIDEG